MGAAEKKETQAAKEPIKYLVYDTTARTGQPRNHDIIVQTYADGREPDVKTYALSSEKATEMPMDHALKFLVDPAFRVERPDGQVIMPPPKQVAGVGLQELPVDQTVAAYNELTRVALYKRCKMAAGGEKITDKSTVQEMADFLIAGRRKAMEVHSTADEQELAARMAGGDLGGAADQSTLDSMFGESPLVAGQAA